MNSAHFGISSKRAAKLEGPDELGSGLWLGAGGSVCEDSGHTGRGTVIWRVLTGRVGTRKTTMLCQWLGPSFGDYSSLFLIWVLLVYQQTLFRIPYLYQTRHLMIPMIPVTGILFSCFRCLQWRGSNAVLETGKQIPKYWWAYFPFSVLHWGFQCIKWIRFLQQHRCLILCGQFISIYWTPTVCKAPQSVKKPESKCMSHLASTLFPSSQAASSTFPVHDFSSLCSHLWINTLLPRLASTVSSEPSRQSDLWKYKDHNPFLLKTFQCVSTTLITKLKCLKWPTRRSWSTSDLTSIPAPSALCTLAF